MEQWNKVLIKNGYVSGIDGDSFINRHYELSELLRKFSKPSDKIIFRDNLFAITFEFNYNLLNESNLNICVSGLLIFTLLVYFLSWPGLGHTFIWFDKVLIGL